MPESKLGKELKRRLRRLRNLRGFASPIEK